MVESGFVLRENKQIALKTSKEQVNSYCGLSRRRFWATVDEDWRADRPLLSLSSIRITLECECERGKGSGEIERSELISNHGI